MLTGGDGDLYRAGLIGGGGSYRIRVEVWQRGVRVDPFGEDGLPLVGGSITASLRSGVTRTLNLSTTATNRAYRNGGSLVPWAGGDLLDPLSSELRVFAGWRRGSWSSIMWPVFRGPIIDVSARSDGGDIGVSASDLAESVVASEFVSPRSCAAGALVSPLIRDLIDDVFDTTSFGVFDETYAVMPATTWDSSRSGALDDLATAAGSFWYALADGSFVSRLVPWGAVSYGPPVTSWSTTTGMVSCGVKLSRDGVRNVVVVSSNSSAGAEPAFGVAMDLDPMSRTFVHGPLGGRVLRISGATAQSSGQAQSIAMQRLKRTRATGEEWSADLICDPSLELGDVCQLEAFGRTVLVSLTSFTLPLVGEPVMSSTWRVAGGVVDD